MIKEGTIIENYQGRFAKVATVKDKRLGLTAWVSKKADAEADTKVVKYLNTFGLSQVIKPEEKAPSSNEPKVLTIADMKVAPLRKLAADFNLSTDGNKPDLVKRITEGLNDQVEKMADHVVTEEDLKANPVFAEVGIKVGDTIKVPKTE